MGTPSSAEYEYALLCRLLELEEGRRSTRSPPPADGGAPCTSSEPPPPSRRTPAWASAIRGFSNTLWLVILVFVIAPLAMRSTDMEKVFLTVGIFLTSLGIPVLGYVFTWDQP